jgi:GGDEF domain-containing protein
MAGAMVAPPPRLVPERFESLVDALVHGGDVGAVCTEIGCTLASDGASLPEALEALRQTYALSTGFEPSFEATRALTTSWTEASLQYLHALSCEDPLTGLASLAHVRSRLSEIYREADRRGTNVAATHALVVVDVVPREADQPSPGSTFDRVLRMAGVAECIRAVYSGGETLGRLGVGRAVAVVERATRLGSSVAVLRQLLAEWGGGGGRDEGPATPPLCRLWIEPLPVDNDAAGRLLDELAR